jgi:chemotaxis protein MotB
MPPPKKKDSDTDKVSLLILRRRGGHGDHPHHGGAWKIAYADFVTAMMAFFLLMWLLNSTNKSDKQGIADFFNRPLAIAKVGGNSVSASDSILNGGGKDLTTSRPGETRHGDDSKQQNPVLVPNATTQASADAQTEPQASLMPAIATSQQAAKTQSEQSDDAQRLQALKARLDKMIEANPQLAQFRNQIKIDITTEGLRIQIVDAQNRPMFATGKAVLEPYAKEILDQIGTALNDVSNHISIAGHTDSAPYAGAESGYSNWELSSERANSARRELGVGGLAEQKVLQVRGLADALPLNKADPAEPSNRRISIVVLNKRTEDAFFRDGGRTDLNSPGQLPGVLGETKPGASAPVTSASAAAGSIAGSGGGASGVRGGAGSGAKVTTASATPGAPAPGTSASNEAASPQAVVARIKAAVSAPGAAGIPGVSGISAATPVKTSATGAIAMPAVTPASTGPVTTAVFANHQPSPEGTAGR